MIKKIFIMLFVFMFISESVWAQGNFDMHPEAMKTTIDGLRDVDLNQFKDKSIMLAMNSEDFQTICKTMGKEDIHVYFKDKEVGRWTKEQFDAIIKASEFMEQITDAEKNGRVSITLADDPWKISLGTDYKSKMTINWRDENNKILKSVTVNILLETTKDGRAWVVYRNVSAILFPVSVLAIIVLLLIILVK